jgi:3-oxoadipate enol-lactonase
MPLPAPPNPPSTSPTPPGHRVDLPGRGHPWVWDSGGPPGTPTVVLLHGWTSTAALNWSRCFGPLSAEMRVVAMDHRGHGRGISSLRPFRLEDCADDVAALLATLDIPTAVIAGYSMGGPVAQLLWRRHPQVVTGLVLCATAARFPRPPVSDVALEAVSMALSLTLGLVPNPVRRQAFRQLAQRRPEFSTMAPWAQEESALGDPIAFVQAGAALARFDSTAWLRTINVPTTSIITTRDATVAPEEQRRLAAGIPDNRIRTVAADHRACVDAADAFVPALLGACWDIFTETGPQDPRPPAHTTGPGAT